MRKMIPPALLVAMVAAIGYVFWWQISKPFIRVYLKTDETYETVIAGNGFTSSAVDCGTAKLFRGRKIADFRIMLSSNGFYRLPGLYSCKVVK